MTYQELKTELRTLQAQGHAIPALNSKKEVLQKALTEIHALIESTAPEIIQDVAVRAGADRTALTEILEILQAEVIEPEPAVIEVLIESTAPEIIQAEVIEPEHPALVEVREIAKGLEIALIWAIALVRIMIRVSTPHIKKALLAALRFTIYAIALLRYWLLPKAQLIAYTVGIWGLAIALKIIRSRGVEIA